MTLAGSSPCALVPSPNPVQSQMVVMGDMSLGGTVVQVRNLAESLQVAFDAGAKRILLPMSSVTDIPSVPGAVREVPDELLRRIRWMRFKALGVEDCVPWRP